MSEQLNIIKQSFDNFTMQEASDDNYVIKGYATTYDNVDLVGDVIKKGAFAESFKQKGGTEPVLLWQHQHDQPVGKGMLQDSDHGVILTAKLPKNDDFVKNRLMPQINIGAIKSFSVGMFVDTSSIEYKKDAAYIGKAAIYETSFVTFPANPSAQIMSVKSLVFADLTKEVAAAKTLPLADVDVSWDATSAIENVRKFTKSTDAPSTDYKKAFLYYDAQNQDNFTAYKLPFADVIDGELKAIPRALSAAVGAINGARGGLSGVPDNDLSKIKAIIASYYKKMGKDDPFMQKMILIDEVKKFTSKRDIENVLRESGLFSKSAALYLASRFDLTLSESAVEQKDLHSVFTQELQQLINFKGK